jgi:hypothetical protein
MFYDNNEAVPYRGEVDEIRIWNYARNLEEIRTTMCKKLQGDEIGLLAYYPLNESFGSIANDNSNQTNTGALFNFGNQAWRVSGAGIGDTSVYLYPDSWASQNFSLGSEEFGSLQIALVSENVEGIQIYRVNQAPFYSGGLTEIVDDAQYFGVVVAGQNGPFEYLLSYNYGGYTEALADEDNLVLFNRNNASENSWNIFPTSQDINTNQLFRDNVSSGREFYLGTRSGAECEAPTDVLFTTLSENAVNVNWQTNVSESVNLEFGITGFSPGSASQLIVSESQILLEDIIPNTLYDFYIQNNCSDSAESAWVGPFEFYSAICEAPTNVFMISSNGNSATLGWSGNADLWRIQWGPVGFLPGTGIQIGNISENTRTITGLTPSTSYEFYIRAECSFGNSAYTGPFLFITTDDVGLSLIPETKVPLLYPNPAREFVTLVNINSHYSNYKVTSLAGEILISGSISNSAVPIALDILSAGVYIFTLHNENESVSSRLVIMP